MEEKKEELFEVAIGLPDGEKWSSEKLEMIKKFVKEIDRKRTPEQRKKIEEAAERCRMEEKGDKS